MTPEPNYLIEKKMRIGIVTFWWSQCNYGQVLQAFALLKYFNQMGHDAFVIRYDHRREPINGAERVQKIMLLLLSGRLIGYLLKRYTGRKTAAHCGEADSSRGFDGFRNTHMFFSEQEYNSLASLRRCPPHADMYVCGSDQIWNPTLWGRPLINHVYFLDFGGPEVKRAAFAASFGQKTLSRRISRGISSLLSHLDVITVRETSGQKLLEEMGIAGSRVICDPTLLVGHRLFYELAAKGLRPNTERYCLVYMIGNKARFPQKEILAFAAESNWKIIFVGSGFECSFPNEKLSIEDWLAAIQNAEYVITNSFHGTVFSILFQRQFALLPLHGNARKMSSRLQELLSCLEVSDRYYSEEKKFRLSPIEYTAVNKKLEALRNLQNTELKELFRL